ncbi:MAG: helix-turn-helix domain-containing protein [Chloroflexi bacterium]|nr:helix-turn-helix domain-containing protein [Chloroflexota bacterium]
MAGPLPLAITVSPPQQAVLEALLRQPATPQALALRVRIVLAAASGLRNVPLARDLGCTPKTVIKWRARWAAAEAQLAALEGDAADLKRMIARVLADAPRPGAPDTFTAEQIVQIINLACSPPADAGRPVTAWTPRALADEAVKRQIVASISPTSVGRFLKAGRSAAASQPLLAQC